MLSPSYKKELIYQVIALSSIEGLEQNTLIFLTSMGLITGETVIVDEPHTSIYAPDSVKTLRQLCQSSYEDYLEKHRVVQLGGNDGSILLKKVTVEAPQRTYTLDSLVLFFDQIIGITLADKPEG